jgi:hypothetical protein
VKLSQTQQVIENYAESLKAARADSTVVADLRAIAAFLGEFPVQQMSTLVDRGLKVGSRAGAQLDGAGASACSDAAAQLERLAKILVSGGGKAERTKDVTSLSKLLRRLSDSETLSAAIEKLRTAMKPEPIEHRIDSFIRRLKEETGTAAFDDTFAELAASSLKREHVVAIAKSVYGGISRDTSRRDALDYIRKPHDAYMSAKRGIDATGGRSAA